MSAGSSTLRTAVRDAARFDRSAISLPAGALAAIPVVGLLGILIAAGEAVPAVTSAVGAMLVGIAWRVNGGRPPLAVMATDALLMGLATLIGALTGAHLWLHLASLAAVCLAGGVLVGLGRKAGIVGFQAILAAVVFGRFPEPIGPALGIAGLVAAGGLVQVGFQAIVRWPPPLVVQRRSTAAAYRALAELARGSSASLALTAAGALDEAEASLAGATLYGAAALVPLRSLVREGQRLRVSLTALTGVGVRLQAGGEAAGTLRAIDEQAAAALEQVAATIEDRGDAREALTEGVTRACATIDATVRAAAPDPEPAAVWATLGHGLAALGGQLRAAAAFAPDAGTGGGLRARGPQARTNRPGQRLRADLGVLRASLSRDSPAARHAVRLAVVVPAAELLARALPVHRGYWIVVAAAAVLRPEFGSTFTRGTERAVGTALGVALAGLIAAALHPGEWTTVGLVGLMAFGGYASFAASYAVGFGFITALVVFLLNVLLPETLSTASARLIDTLIGGAFGLLVFSVWPTWARIPAQASLAELVDALRRYQGLLLGALVRGEPLPAEVRGASRAARLARTRADSTVARSLTEPPGRRIDARIGSGALDEALRIVRALHALRIDEEEAQRPLARPRLQPLARALDVQLGAVARALTSPGLALSREHVDLRALADGLRDGASAAERELLEILDELVDAVNSLAEIVERPPAA